MYYFPNLLWYLNNVNFSYVTRIDFEEGELGSKYEKELNQVISDLDEKVEEVIPEEEIEFDERLSPKLEKMILNSPAPEKRKELVRNSYPTLKLIQLVLKSPPRNQNFEQK